MRQHVRRFHHSGGTAAYGRCPHTDRSSRAAYCVNCSCNCNETCSDTQLCSMRPIALCIATLRYALRHAPVG
eukprot:363318-Chlamydomonas_euryale.AAC.8